MHKIKSEIRILKVVFLMFLFCVNINAQMQNENATNPASYFDTTYIKSVLRAQGMRKSMPSRLETPMLESVSDPFEANPDFSKTFAIKTDAFSGSISMGGLLDAENTISRGYFGIEEQAFQNMRKITIRNNGRKTIAKSRLIINDERNWYSSANIAKEAVKGAETMRDTLLSIWKFVKDNRGTEFPPCWDGVMPFKMFTTYGYATCETTSYNAIEIARKLGLANPLTCNMTHHVVPEMYVKGKGAILDSNLGVFYLSLDNQDFVGLDDVLNDKYLIQRTSHYEKFRTKWWTSQEISQMYTDPDRVNRQYTSAENFDFILKPQESIEFSWEKAQKYYHNWEGNTNLMEFFLQHIISNSKHIFSVNFKETALQLDELFEKHDNVTLVDSESVGLKPAKDAAYFIYRAQLPFPILSSTISGLFRLGDSSESIQVFLSLDNEQSWVKVWEKNNTNSGINSFDLSGFLAYPLSNENSTPTYRYSLKFLFSSPNSTTIDCGIDSLRIENTFQISKFFLPQLKLGENNIEYTDANGNDPDRNVEVTIEWQESWENKPPNKVAAPTFPLHQAKVDSLYFAFTWEPATDDDGDKIVDYEFMLSGDDRMLYPYSPNFNLYVSSFGEETIRPYFKVKETGWFNDGQTYYWRVRAKDARGAWGEWSDTWSFTPYGVMRPVNEKAEIVEQSVRLSWKRNLAGKQPDYYKIYASDEMNGFSPDESTFFAIADSTEFIIPFDKKIAPFSFYRVAACDTLGQESLISGAIAIPYPYIYSAYDSLQTGSAFRLNLFSNERFYPFFHYNYGEDLFIPAITVLQKPEWLNQQANVLYSNDGTLARRMVYMDSIQCSVLVELNDSRGNSAQQRLFLRTAAVNNKPALMISDSVLCKENSFLAYVASTDGDIAFGDINYYTILQKPAWLSCNIKGDTILLFANGGTGEDSLLRILAVDTKNDSTTAEFSIRFKPYEQMEANKVLCRHVLKSSNGIYYAKAEATKEAEFGYNLYSANGVLLFSSPNYYLTGGIYYLPIDMEQYSDGIYIFVGIEDNRMQQSIKFIKK